MQYYQDSIIVTAVIDIIALIALIPHFLHTHEPHGAFPSSVKVTMIIESLVTVLGSDHNKQSAYKQTAYAELATQTLNITGALDR